MSDLITELFRLTDLLQTALSEAVKRGRALAEAERAYRVALAKKTFLLREEGQPATLIENMAKGDEHVADLKFARDVAEADYDSSREAINAYKKTIDVYREQISREWERA